MKVLTANEMKSKPSKLPSTSLIGLQKDTNPDLTTLLPVPMKLFLINLLVSLYGFVVCLYTRAKLAMSLQRAFVAHHRTSPQHFRITQLFAIVL